jgi:hypothetical protein
VFREHWWVSRPDVITLPLPYITESLPHPAALSAGDVISGQRQGEAITIAAARGLVPAYATALAARARLRAAQATITGNTSLL